MERLRAELVSRGLMRVTIHGDGFCLYRAIAHGLCQDQEAYMPVFSAALRFYDSERGRQFFNDLDLGSLNGRDRGGATAGAQQISREEYIRKLRSPAQPDGLWGGEPEMMAIAKEMRINIEVIVIAGPNWRAAPSIMYTPDSGPSQQGPSRQGSRTVTIVWTHGSHYDAATPCDKVVQHLGHREDRKGGQSPKNFLGRPLTITPLGSGKRHDRGRGDRDERDQVKRVRHMCI